MNKDEWRWCMNKEEWELKRKEQEKGWEAEYEAEAKLLESARSKLTKEEYDAVLKEGHYTEYL